MTLDSQNFESFVPVYDTVPNEWSEARQFLVEHLKKISNMLNGCEIGFFLEEELLSGKQFEPSDAVDPPQTRSIFRKVVNLGALSVGANSIAHGITFDSNFTLIDYWVAATDSSGLTAINMVYDEVDMDSTNVNVNSPAAYDRAYFICEYIREV